MKMKTVFSALASLVLLVGVALAQTANPPSSEQSKPTAPETGGPSGPSTPTPGSSMGGNEGQNLPAGTMPGPAAGGQPAGVKSGGQAGAVEGGNLPAGAVATPDIALVNANLVTAATNANMLSQIAASPATYNPEHGQMFIANIKQAVTQADARLANLKPMAHGKAMSDIQDVQARLDKVKEMLPKMEADLANPKAVRSGATQCTSQLRSAMAPLKKASSTMHAKVAWGSTG